MAAGSVGGWTGAIAVAAGQRLMADGTVAELSRLKRIDAARREQMAAKHLAGSGNPRRTPNTYHLWLTLPPHWRSQTVGAAAARRDIALTPSTTFAVAPRHAPETPSAWRTHNRRLNMALRRLREC